MSNKYLQAFTLPLRAILFFSSGRWQPTLAPLSPPLQDPSLGSLHSREKDHSPKIHPHSCPHQFQLMSDGEHHSDKVVL